MAVVGLSLSLRFRERKSLTCRASQAASRRILSPVLIDEAEMYVDDSGLLD